MTARAPAAVPPLTPEQRRAARKAAAARALAASLERHGVPRARLAAAADVPEQHARAWADPEQSRSMPVHALAAIDRRVCLDVCEEALGPGWVIAALPPALPVTDDLRQAARIAQGGGAVLEGYLAALADGALDRVEIADIRRRVREQVRELVSLDASLERAEQALGRPMLRPLRVVGGE